MQIVIGWVVEEMKWNGEAFAVDLGRSPKFVMTMVPKVCMWLNDGSHRDVEKAQKYVERDIENGRVFTFHGVSDPLGEARTILCD